jgi:hypothetical protein
MPPGDNPDNPIPEDRQRMSCPRCPVQLRRRQMVQHLWEVHGLMLDGHRVREPWQLIEDWITSIADCGLRIADSTDQAAIGNLQAQIAHLQARCRALGQRLDPANGLLRVQRLFLAHGVEDAEARETLRAEAEQQQATLCPYCYALVPVPKHDPPRALNSWRGRLSAPGYRVEVSEAGLFSRLEIETPAGILYRGREPAGGLTRRGATFLLAGPLVGLALILAMVLPGWDIPPVPSVLFVLLTALVISITVRRRWRTPVALADRALDHAWTLLAPRLHAAGFSAQDSAFLASLALTSMDRGRASLRDDILERAVNLTEKAVATGVGAVRHLAVLRRLMVEMAATGGQDPVPLVAAQVGRCFDGKLPLVFAEGLLADWQSALWTRGNLARLRVLLCDRAFEAGLEMGDLMEAGYIAPSLGAVLRSDDQLSLAHLRLLWSLRPRRPWDHCGEASTVFELAADQQGRGLLSKHPDLLLYQAVPSPQTGGSASGENQPWAEILLCDRGVVFQDTLFASPPRTVEVVSRNLFFRGGYELGLGEFRFHFDSDPEALANRLERWFRYYFNEFQPLLADVASWQSPAVAASIRAQEAVSCPECRRVLLARIGDVGIG